jgi:hypothetical protein
MKIIIQHQRTRLYLKSDGTWTKMRHEAEGFPSPVTALTFAVEQKLDDSELIFRPDNEFQPLAAAEPRPVGPRLNA